MSTKSSTQTPSQSSTESYTQHQVQRRVKHPVIINTNSKSSFKSIHDPIPNTQSKCVCVEWERARGSLQFLSSLCLLVGVGWQLMRCGFPFLTSQRREALVVERGFSFPFVVAKRRSTCVAVFARFRCSLLLIGWFWKAACALQFPVPHLCRLVNVGGSVCATSYL